MVTVTCDKCGTVLTRLNAVTHKAKCRARRPQVVYAREPGPAERRDTPTTRANATPKLDSQEAAMLKAIEGRPIPTQANYHDPH